MRVRRRVLARALDADCVCTEQQARAGVPACPRHAPLFASQGSFLNYRRRQRGGSAGGSADGTSRPEVPACCSQLPCDLKPGACGDHRRGSSMDRVDDLGAVDSLEEDACDTEVGMAELALDDDERDSFV